MSEAPELRRAPDVDGVPARTLATRLGVPRFVALAETTSTLDIAHALGEVGAPAGTVIVADRQTAGRGRLGRTWTSLPGAGLWLTILERGLDPAAVAVLSIRLGLAAAPVLERFAPAAVQLKWPNDLFCEGRKLAGILAEARWRDGRVDWVAVAIGVNIAPPPELDLAARLRPGTTRVAVLEQLVPALRAAAALHGPLSEAERAAFGQRDLAAGRAIEAPVRGRAVGVSADGALLVEQGSERVAVHSGSLHFAREGA